MCFRAVKYILFVRATVPISVTGLATCPSIKVAVNVSGGEQTFPQIMADISLSVH